MIAKYDPISPLQKVICITRIRVHLLESTMSLEIESAEYVIETVELLYLQCMCCMLQRH